MKRRFVVVLIILVSLLFTGCGEKKGKKKDAAGSKDTPGGVFLAFTSSLKNRKYKQAWDCLSEKARSQYFIGKSNKKGKAGAFDNFKIRMEKMMKSERRRVEVVSAVIEEEKVDGDKAFVRIVFTRVPEYKGPDPEDQPALLKSTRLHLKKIDEGWRIHVPEKKASKETGKGEKKDGK